MTENGTKFVNRELKFFTNEKSYEQSGLKQIVNALNISACLLMNRCHWLYKVETLFLANVVSHCKRACRAR